MVQAILLVGIVCCLAWLVLRVFPGNRKNLKSAYGNSSRPSPYHAVTIHPGTTACHQAREMLHKRYLSREAPQLPLAGCSAQRCRCVYQHHSDRRTGDGDRRAIGSTARSVVGAQGEDDRRHSRGRRAVDNDNDLSWA